MSPIDETTDESSVPATVGSETALGTDGAAESARAKPSRVLRPGEHVSRYAVLEVLGRGGMGIVYAAYDPELDRKVALKLLRFGDRAQAKDRLVQEARALAKLSHPNVVAVYDSGTHDDQVFLAMEFVRGQTLTDWMKGEPGREQVLQVYRAAARGLVAAHQAGLVHRDFKPDNVMLGEDGRVRVMDFGLARADAVIGEDAPVTEPSDARLTQIGARMGTPAYMAPEQHLGLDTDARTDQFSFCVAFWESLFGERPFAGDTAAALAAATTSGEIVESAVARAAPTHLRTVLRRGLAADPEDRFASMDALMEELSRDPAARRRRMVGAALLVLGLGSVVGAGIYGASGGARCGGVEERFVRLWTPAVAEAVGGRMAKVDGDSSERILAGLEGQARKWAQVDHALCVDESIAADSAAAVGCLAARNREVIAMAAVMTDLKPENVGVATEAVAAFPDPRACLADRVVGLPLPPDVVAGSEAARIRLELARADAQHRLGDPQGALLTLQPVRDSAARLNFQPLLAEVMYAVAKVAEETKQPAEVTADYSDAIYTAVASDHQVVEFDAVARFARYAANELRDADLARTYQRHAEAVATQVGLTAQREIELEVVRGAVATAAHDLKAAEQHARRLLELRRALHGQEHPRTASAVGNLAAALYRLSDYDQALELWTRALELRERTLGPRHPSVARTLNNLAVLANTQGRLEEARKLHERSLEIRRAAYPDKHPAIVSSLYNLAIIDYRMGNDAQALKGFEEVLALRRESMPAGHASIVDALDGISSVSERLKDHARTDAVFEEILAARKNAGDHYALARTYLNRGLQLVSRERYEDSIPLFDEAERTLLGAPAPNEDLLGDIIQNRAIAHYETKAFAEGLQEGRRALEIRERIHADPAKVGFSEYIIAQSLFELGRRGDATMYAERALSSFGEAQGRTAPRVAAELTAWAEASGLTLQPNAAAVDLTPPG